MVVPSHYNHKSISVDIPQAQIRSSRLGLPRDNCSPDLPLAQQLQLPALLLDALLLFILLPELPLIPQLQIILSLASHHIVMCFLVGVLQQALLAVDLDGLLIEGIVLLLFGGFDLLLLLHLGEVCLFVLLLVSMLAVVEF